MSHTNNYQKWLEELHQWLNDVKKHELSQLVAYIQKGENEAKAIGRYSIKSIFFVICRTGKHIKNTITNWLQRNSKNLVGMNQLKWPIVPKQSGFLYWKISNTTVFIIKVSGWGQVF